MAAALVITALAALSTSGRLETACIRRAILGLPVAAVLVPRAARADDDLDDDDEVPMQAAIAPKNRKKPGDAQRTFSAADVKYAYADIVAAREALNTVGRLVSASDLVSVAPLLGKPPFSSVEGNLLALVQGPGLGPDAKIQIGTIKRYGIGADVLIMLGGLNEAVTGADATKAKSFTQKSKDAIDEVIAVCKDSGLSPNEELERRGAK